MDKHRKKDKISPLEKGGDDMNTTIERYCSVTESLTESLKQMKLIREGKLPKKSWKDLKHELKSKDEK